MMDQVFKDKRLPTGELLPMAQAQVLEEIVNRRLVLAYARRLGEAPTAEELAKAKKQLQIQIAAQGRKVADVLKAESMTMADLQRQVVWGLVWGRYLSKYRTPERRETWFQNHHEEVDGNGTGREPNSASSGHRGGAERRPGPGEAGRNDPRRDYFRQARFCRGGGKIFRRPQCQAGRPTGPDRPPRSDGRWTSSFPGLPSNLRPQ